MPLAGQSPLAPMGAIIAEQSRTAFCVQGAGARAMGMGGAFIAIADDATAVTFNPAGLAQMVKPELSWVGQGINRDVRFQDPQTIGHTKTTVADDSLISNTRFDPLLLAGTVPLRVNGKTLALQLSIQRIIPLGEGDSRDMAEHPLDGSAPSALHQSINQTGQIDVYSFALAYEVSQRILLGISGNLWRGSWRLNSDSSTLTSGQSTFINYNQYNRLEGANYNLGLLWRWPTWSLGLSHRTGFHADYSYNANLVSSAGSTVSPAVTTGLHWPATDGIGLAVRPAEKWLLAMDLTHTDWSEARFMTVNPFLNGQNFFDMSRGHAALNATSFRVGMERLFLTESGDLVPLRMGYSREPQPVTDPITGQQRVVQGLSVGTGFKRAAYTFDLAYRYGWGTRRVSQFLDVNQILAGTHSTFLGTENLTEHRLDLSFIVQFEREPVVRLLNYLFVGD